MRARDLEADNQPGAHHDSEKRSHRRRSELAPCSVEPRPGSGSAESREIRILASTSEMVARGRKEEVEVLAGKKTETCRNVSPHVTFPGNTLVSLLTRADLLCINPHRARTR